MRDQTLAHRLSRQQIAVVLANARQGGLPEEQLFEAQLVVEQLRKLVMGSELPRHVARRKQPCVTVSECALHRGFERLDHSIHVEMTVDEMRVVRDKHKRATRQLAFDIRPSGVQLRTKAGDHRRTVQVHATRTLVEMQPNRRCDRRQLPRRSSVVDHALVPPRSRTGHRKESAPVPVTARCL